MSLPKPKNLTVEGVLNGFPDVPASKVGSDAPERPDGPPAGPYEERPLPGLLQEIADAAGRPAALAVARAKGGQRTYLPGMDVRENHWLSQLVGHDKAKAIAKAICPMGLVIDIPMASSVMLSIVIRELHEAGKSANFIAAAAGVSSRTVMRHVAVMKRRRNSLR